MTQENVPISSASKESIFKRARYGLISLAFFLSALIIVIIMFGINEWQAGFDFSTMSSAAVQNVIETRNFWLGNLQWLLLLIIIFGIVFAGIGLKADKAKAITKTLLFLWIPGMCVLAYGLFILYAILSGHGGELP